MTQSSSPSSLLPSDAVSEDQGERTEVVTVGDDDDGAAIASGVSQVGNMCVWVGGGGGVGVGVSVGRGCGWVCV